MLYLISIGLWSIKDISLNGLEAIEKCDVIYFENYTSYYDSNLNDIKKITKNDKIIAIKREELENNSKKIILEAKEKNKVKTKIIHSSSIFTAISETGLSLYSFGKITSLPFNYKDLNPPYNILLENKDLHTLILLDLEPENKKYMLAKEAIEYFIKKGLDKEKLCIICASLGSEKQNIIIGKAKELVNNTLKNIPQCLIIPGKLHFIEQEFLSLY